MITPQWKVSGRRSKRIWSIANTTEPALKPTPLFLLSLRPAITVSLAIRRWAISALTTSNNSFCLSAWSTQTGQDHIIYSIEFVCTMYHRIVPFSKNLVVNFEKEENTWQQQKLISRLNKMS